MRNVLTYIIILIATLAGMAQPVTRIRLITLQAPPDTTTQYFIQAGGGRDTIKYVPIDTVVANAGGGNIYTTDGTLTGSRTITLDSFPLTFDLDNPATFPGDSMAIRIIAPDGVVNGWWVSDADSPVALIVNSLYSTDFHRVFAHTVGSTHIMDIGNTSDTTQINADKLFLNQINVGTDNTVTQVLGYKSSTKEIVFTDASGTGASWTSGYAEAAYNGSSTQSIANTFTVLNPMTGGDLATGWAWSTVNDRFTYTGGTETYLLHFDFTAHCSSNTFDELTVSIRENSTETTARGQIECENAGVSISTSGSAIITANNGDTFDLGAYWTTSASSNISIKHLNFTAIKL